MNDTPFEVVRDTDDGTVLTTNRARIPVDAALALLKTTYWADALTRATLLQAMENSLCFGLLRRDVLVGFARVVTDRATFAYLTDVVVAGELRGQGLGRWLMQCILHHPDFQGEGLRRFALLTGDAVPYYEGFGFTAGAGALTYMERVGPATSA